MTDQTLSMSATRPAGADLAADGLVAYFQPFYNLGTSALQGVEALARLAGDAGASTPGPFFDAVRDSGRMAEVDRWILRQSVQQLSRLQQEADLRRLILSVNLSGEFVCSEGFHTEVLEELEAGGVAGDRLLVDISTATFRRLQGADSGAFARLVALQEQEVTFCLDGFTVDDLDLLPALTDARVDIVKLHPREIAEGDSDRLSAIVTAVHDAGLPAVVAGIETPDQLRQATELGFGWAQGFLLGAPAPGDEVLASPRVLTI